MRPEFKDYQQQVLKNAKALCDALLRRGYKVVSGNLCSALMNCGYKVVSGNFAMLS